MFDKKNVAVMFSLVFLLGGVFGVAIGSVNPMTHDFQLNHTATTIIDNDIIVDFQIQSYNLIGSDLNLVVIDFMIVIPIEEYNGCRASGNSVVTCKSRLVDSIELRARDILVDEFQRLKTINIVAQDFSNELSERDFDDVTETRIDDAYRDVIDPPDVNVVG